ncbi:hypothetical protein [Desulfobacter latus]|uniref:Tetratricopeptide repeat protein n=1 Tax=Desulfobacter latus TaxID=2292 RepID=A0A850TAH1_9BACT|nr:hypothetical protein [Desulfobacter latus]NWH04376.1 hypothetical protein [Desulfobacter latus]
MARKKNKIDTLLKRAEKLFNAGNYIEAEEKFLKAQRQLNSPKIEEKLAVCRRETNILRGKELIAKGEQSIQENDLSLALDCFKQAAALVNEPWLTEKILELETLNTGRRIYDEARSAAASGDMAAAATLYEKAAAGHLDLWETHKDHDALKKAAVYLTKAGDFPKALDLFDRVGDFDAQARYHFGFALAKTGDYLGAMAQWQSLDCRDTAFLEQRGTVLANAVDQVYRELKAGTSTGSAHESDIQEKYKKAEQVSALIPPDDSRELKERIEALLVYANVISARMKWEAADYEAVVRLVENLWVDPELIRLKAAACYHISKDRNTYLDVLSECWMDAVGTLDGLTGRYLGNEEKTTEVRDRLIRMAHMRINRASASGEKESAKAGFDIQTRISDDFRAISQHSGLKLAVCSPRYAAMTGRSELMLAVIRSNKAYFKNDQHYLETGGYYSRAGLSLLALKTGDIESAVKSLDSLDMDETPDEFTQYAGELIRFEYGLKALESGQKNFMDYFSSTHLLFKAAPAIEARFSDRMLQDERDHLLAYETLTAFLYSKRPSRPIARALSVLLAKAGIVKYNDDKLTDKQFRVTVKKALELDPDNQFALQLLDSTNMEAEMDVLLKIMGRGKFEKAAQMAVDSDYPEIRESFFEMAEKISGMIHDQDVSPELIKLELIKLKDAVAVVDRRHDLVKQIQREIKTIGA